MKILFVLLMLFPVLVSADECDYDKLSLATDLMKEVNYKINYSEKNKTYSVTFYNVVDYLLLEYSGKTYYGDDSDNVIIKGLKEGSNFKVAIRTNISNCSSNTTNKYVNLPYVNIEDCDYDELSLATKLMKEVNYEINYNEKNETFIVTFYNVVDLIYLEYSDSLYFGDDNNEVVIKGLKEGSNARIKVSTSVSNCNSNSTNKHVNVPYVNPYFGSEICVGYEYLKPCGAEFLGYENNLSIVKSAIDNDNNGIEPDIKNEGENENTTLFMDMISFIEDWWLKIIIMILVTIITVMIYNSRYRKLKHGI